MSVQTDKESFIGRLTDIIDANITNAQFGVIELANEVGMSRSNLHRKLKSLTGDSVSRFICRVRLGRAKELLNESTNTISEIAFETGFHSVTYFAKCFKEQFGYTPGEERKHIHGEGSPKSFKQREEHVGIGKRQIPIFVYLSTIFILVAISAFIVIWRPFEKKREPLKIPFAVLPFINDSPEESEMYFINGTMESILDNLGKIEVLRVVSRTSVEQYRNSLKPIKEIGRELNVSYLLEGSGLKYGDSIRLTVQLIDAIADQHMWSNTFYRRVDEVFALQSEIAQKVAAEIEAVVTPQEKELIEKVPTTNKVAYDLYLHAWEGLGYYSDRSALYKAIDLLHLSVKYDSTFALPYARLGWIYNVLYDRNPVVYPQYHDSSLVYANIALTLDDQCEFAYELKANYYSKKGNIHEAIECLDRALEINPNLYDAYRGKGWIHSSQGEYIKSIENFSRALQLTRDIAQITCLTNLGTTYVQAGFPEKQIELIQERLALTDDSLDFLRGYAYAEAAAGNFQGALDAAMRGFQFSTTDFVILQELMMCYLSLGKDEKAMEYCNLYLGQMEAENDIIPYSMPEIIYLLKKSGNDQKADYYLEWFIEYDRNIFDTQPVDHLVGSAKIRALQGDFTGAYHYLEQLREQDKHSIWVNHIRNSPLFEEISSEAAFINVVGEIEKKFGLQRERDRKWLEENDML